MESSPTDRSPRYAVWCHTREVNSARALASAGFDAIIFDAQHGDLDRSALVVLGRALSDVGAEFGVRVSGGSFTEIGAALDAGATTIIVPQVDTVADARSVVDATFYPPVGRRSWGQLAVLWGGTTREAGAANEAITCAVMIESARALDNVEEIAGVPGLDMLFVGPFDLSLSLGIGVETVAAEGGPLSVVREAASRRNLTLGAFAGDLDRAREFRGAGVDFVVVATDLTVLKTGAAAVLARMADGEKPSAGGAVT
jgi:4-hydroxy-2-oxoheptanedioate aldolase